MGWLEKHHAVRWPLIWHTPNEVKASIRHMQQRAKQGVKKGVVDIIDAGGPVNGFFEIKRIDHRPKPGGKIHRSYATKEQKEFLQAGSDAGHFCAICHGLDQFKLAYADFLEVVRLRS